MKPLLFLSDSPFLPTGLARITKDLACLASELPEFRVGCLGRGGIGSSKLPFSLYCFDEAHQWGEEWIQQVWEDFAGSQHGIIMTIWDLSRLDYLARPKMGGPLQAFLQSGRFEKWAYVPVDSYGIGGKLTSIMADTLQGFDRILAYTIFGSKVIENTLGRPVEWIPHGINGDVFQPRDRHAGRAMLGVKDDEQLVGCVMTNQSRKDWPIAFNVAATLRRLGLKFWFHTDVDIRYWNLHALAEDFGVRDSIIVTHNGDFNSVTLSYLLSACDITMLPSGGEGFGFPLVESMACGVPVVTGNYGGGVELIPEQSWLVDKSGERLDGPWNQVRPIWLPQRWAEHVDHALTDYGSGSYKDFCVNAVSHLLWRNLWPSCWKKWMLGGLK